MQGLLVKTSTGYIKAYCNDCKDLRPDVTSGRDIFPLEGTLEMDVQCYECNVAIDGEEEEPKPESFTVMVQVIVFAGYGIETAQDAQDLVKQELCHFEVAEVQEVLEHF